MRCSYVIWGAVTCILCSSNSLLYIIVSFSISSSPLYIIDSLMIPYVMLCYVMLCYVMLCYKQNIFLNHQKAIKIFCHVMLCYFILCYVMLCYTMLYHAMLCYVDVLLGLTAFSSLLSLWFFMICTSSESDISSSSSSSSSSSCCGSSAGSLSLSSVMCRVVRCDKKCG